MPRQQTRVRIRWMIREDMRRVVRIEQDSFEVSWTRRDFRTTLSHGSMMCMVAESMGDVVGFMVYSWNEDCLHLLNIGVDRRQRRCRIGTQMAAKLIDTLNRQYRSKVIADVGERNVPMQLFLKSLGFRCVTIDHAGSVQDEDEYRFEYRAMQPATSTATV